MPLKNYTTTIKASKTVGEIQGLLSEIGARKIMVDYDDDRDPISISFCLNGADGTPLYFELRANWQGILNVLKKEKKLAVGKLNKDTAIRVAWRTMQDFIEAQVAFVEAEMASVSEVFVGNLLLKDGKRVIEYLAGNTALLHSGV